MNLSQRGRRQPEARPENGINQSGPQKLHKRGNAYLIANQLASLHHGLSLLAQLCAGLDRGAQHVAGGQMADLVCVLEVGGLCGGNHTDQQAKSVQHTARWLDTFFQGVHRYII